MKPEKDNSMKQAKLDKQTNEKISMMVMPPESVNHAPLWLAEVIEWARDRRGTAHRALSPIFGMYDAVLGRSGPSFTTSVARWAQIGPKLPFFGL